MMFFTPVPIDAIDNMVQVAQQPCADAQYLAFYRRVYVCEACGQRIAPDALTLTCRCCDDDAPPSLTPP